MKYLIDTCVASESAKRQPSPAVLQWFSSVPAADVFLPSVSLGELHKGIALKAGIQADNAAVAAGDEASVYHRGRANDIKAARRADRDAAREERRWQNRVARAEAQAKMFEQSGRQDLLPRWAREVLASEDARKAADQARAAAAAKQADLEKAEKDRAEALKDMKNNLDQIKKDLKTCLHPAS